MFKTYKLRNVFSLYFFYLCLYYHFICFWREIQGHRKPCLIQELVDVSRVTDVGTAPDTNMLWKDICSITAGKWPKCVPIALSQVSMLVFLILISVPIRKVEFYTSAHFVHTWRKMQLTVESMWPGSIRQRNDPMFIPYSLSYNETFVHLHFKQMFNVKYRGVELSNTDHSIKKLIMRITDIQAIAFLTVSYWASHKRKINKWSILWAYRKSTLSKICVRKKFIGSLGLNRRYSIYLSWFVFF